MIDRASKRRSGRAGADQPERPDASGRPAPRPQPFRRDVAGMIQALRPMDLIGHPGTQKYHEKFYNSDFLCEGIAWRKAQPGGTGYAVMDRFLSAIESWMEHSKLPTLAAALFIIVFALWNIWRALK